ncbi:hypothetical protein BDR26DRAFT_1003673 [Obelidium mucronatum]|nr:hypothetical protein BDR26DRAFT_1003673 [Obelidium mucronatum]
MEECDPAEILDTVLIDAVGRHAVRIQSVIGTGSFAHVYLAESVALGGEADFVPEKRAVKRLFKAGLDERQLLLQRQEAEVMKAMAPHPNVIQLLATVEDEQCLYLVMEYCELDLYEAITQQGGFPEDVVKEVFVQIADSVLHCHSSGFYHRDLKPENCLISTANYKVKLADFGLTTTDEWSTELGCGSVRYMAPECFELTHNTPEGATPGQPVPPPAKSLPVPPGVLNGGYSPAANDVWALGVILLNLLFGKNPWFEAHMTDQIFSAFAISNPNVLRHQFNLTLQFDAILRRVFELDPRRRCSVLDLKQMVESCTQFVEQDPPPAAVVPTPNSQQSKLKRRGHSSILAGPGYIVHPGEPLPAVFTQQLPAQPMDESGTTTSPPEPIRKLRMQPTFQSLKALAAGASSVDLEAMDGLSTVPTKNFVLEEGQDASAIVEDPILLSPAVSTVGVGASSDGAGAGFGQSRRVSVSMSSSSTARDDGEGEFVVVDAMAPILLNNGVAAATAAGDEEVDETPIIYLEDAAQATTSTAVDGADDSNAMEVEEGEIVEAEQVEDVVMQDVAAAHETEETDTGSLESQVGVVLSVTGDERQEEEDDVPENPELMRRLMQEQHADKMMRGLVHDDEEDDESVVVRNAGDGSLRATVSSLAATTLTAYTGQTGRLDRDDEVERGDDERESINLEAVASIVEAATAPVVAESPASGDTAAQATETEQPSLPSTQETEEMPVITPVTAAQETTQTSTATSTEAVPASVTVLASSDSTETLVVPTQAATPTPIVIESVPTSLQSISPTQSTSIIQPPAMARHDSNPYVPPPRHSLATDLNGPAISASSKDRRSSSPMKWFAPFISRETARVDQPPSVSAAAAASQSGKVGFFGARKRPSMLFRMRKPSQEHMVVVASDDLPVGSVASAAASSSSAVGGGASISSRSSTPFGMLRNRRSSQYFSSRHVSGASTVAASTFADGVNNHGIVTPPDDGSSVDALAIEDDNNGKKMGSRKGSSLSMKELSSGLKGVLGMGPKKRSGLLNGERN